MSTQPQLNFLTGEAIKHVIGELAIGNVRGGTWEIESVTRGITHATVVFAVGYRADAGPDERPRVTIEIKTRPWYGEQDQ